MTSPKSWREWHSIISSQELELLRGERGWWQSCQKSTPEDHSPERRPRHSCRYISKNWFPPSRMLLSMPPMLVVGLCVPHSLQLGGNQMCLWHNSSVLSLAYPWYQELHNTSYLYRITLYQEARHLHLILTETHAWGLFPSQDSIT